jgi:Tfp pilus assembly protein PilO
MNVEQSTRLPSRAATPRWLVALLFLQAATLLVALGAWPAASTVEATQGRQQDQDEILPNAAGQRAEQIRLLKVIADEMSEMNTKLGKIQQSLDKPAE